MKPAYYNEIDPFAAQWLRNLIAAGHIAPGDVDERSIEDVHPSDLKPYTQCHFFAGVGVWSYALRRAGWADDRPVWTGSCPCQPFSQAGEGAGFDDQRHLWPHFFYLISQRCPPTIFGEQVASRDANPWIDLVQDDLEGLEYGVGAVPFPSAGVGAPHIRDRLYWMAYANGGLSRQGRQILRGRSYGGDAQPWTGLGSNGMSHRLANSVMQQRPRGQSGIGHEHDTPGWQQGPAAIAGLCCDRGMADNNQHGRLALPLDRGYDAQHHPESCSQLGHMGNTQRAGLALGQRIARIPCGASGADAGEAIERAGIHPPAGPGPTNGLWSAADWLLCRDGKWRPVEPGTFPLVARPSSDMGRMQSGLGRVYGRNRTGRLRGYGNAINAVQAQSFIEAAMSCMP